MKNCLLPAAILTLSALTAGCVTLVETPQEIAARRERTLQANLSLADASCEELQRRGERANENLLEGTNAEYWKATIAELTARCWAPWLATASCENIQHRVDRASDNLLEGTNAGFYRVAIAALKMRCW